jgi:hypothetical protein
VVSEKTGRVAEGRSRFGGRVGFGRDQRPRKRTNNVILDELDKPAKPEQRTTSP